MAERLLLFILIHFAHNIQTQGLPQPKLSVTPSMVKEQDLVTVDCLFPSAVSDQCYFLFTRKQSTKILSCSSTVTGTDLLLMSQQTSPAKVELKCFYTVKFKDSNLPSPHSDTSSIIVHNLLPPTLAVNPPVVSGKESVTLICQAPSDVSVSECHFYSEARKSTKRISCLETLTGSELLMSQQTLPAKLEFKCFYTVKFEDLNLPSPYSDASSIIVQNLLPPTLTVNPPVVSGKESVTLICQAPSDVSVSECHFYSEARKSTKSISCLETLTGSELLMSQQTLPAKLEFKCFYTVKFEDLNLPSPYSDASSIIVQNLLPPTLTVNPPVVSGKESVTLICQAPSDVSVSECHFYSEARKSTKSISCLETLTGSELLMSQQTLPAKLEFKCFYTVKFEDLNLPSPHSDTSSIIVQRDVEITTYTQPASSITTDGGTRESSRRTKQPATTGDVEITTHTQPASSITTGYLSVSDKSDDKTPAGAASGDGQSQKRTWILKFILVAAIFGVTVGLISGTLATRRTVCQKPVKKSTRAGVSEDLMSMSNLDPAGQSTEGICEAYTVVSVATALPGPAQPAGPEKATKQDSQSTQSEEYHVYYTIPDQ